jgi:hypothetical protein
VIIIQAVLNFRMFNFHTTCTFIHFKFSPQSIFCTLNLDFCMQMMYKHFKLLHSGDVCQPSQHIILCKKCFQTAYHTMPTCPHSSDVFLPPIHPHISYISPLSRVVKLSIELYSVYPKWQQRYVR